MRTAALKAKLDRGEKLPIADIEWAQQYHRRAIQRTGAKLLGAMAKEIYESPENTETTVPEKS